MRIGSMAVVSVIMLKRGMSTKATRVGTAVVLAAGVVIASALRRDRAARPVS